MAARRLLGIVFTPSWFRVAQAELLRGQVYSVSLYAVPLPVGCIHENSGVVEDSETLRKVMQSTPVKWIHHGLGVEISVVIPQVCCYRAAFVVPTGLEHASMKDILASYPLDLPGDSGSLVVDSSAHAVSTNGERSVMVLAARRSSLETYAQLFKGREWCLSGITTGEIARYNLWRLQYPELDTQVVLVCSADTDSQEFSMWNRGVLVASDTRYRYQRARSQSDCDSGAGEIFDTATDQLEQELIRMIERAQITGRPIERILLGGALRHDLHLQERLGRLTRIPSENSTRVDRYMRIGREIGDGCSFEVDGAHKVGLFDDVLGAIAPSVFSLHAKKIRGRDDRHQPYP